MLASNRAFNLVILICAAVVLASCSHVNYLREAQDSFNQAAAMDNRDRYDNLDNVDVNGGAANSLSASTGYAATIASIETLKNDSQAKEKLEADGLYGYALAIQSLAYWRLGQWNQAISTSTIASDTGDLGDRDLALMRALPSLIKNDQAFAKIRTDSSKLICSEWSKKTSPINENHCPPAVLDVSNQLSGALCDVDTARISAPSLHPVRKYLALSQLTTIANIMDMCNFAGTGWASPKFISDCPSATIRAGACVKDRYMDDSDDILEAIVSEVCEDLKKRPGGVVFNLVQKSGLSTDRIDIACPQLRSP